MASEPAKLVCTFIGTLLLMLFLSTAAYSQVIQDSGFWSAIFARGNFVDDDEQRWRWWFDGHLRCLDDANGLNQSIARPGIGWAVNDHTVIWLGYAWIGTSFEDVYFDEHRIWQQLTWSKEYGSVRLAARSRLEQRFIDLGDETAWRFRQLCRLQHRLPRCPRLTLVCWDELFINLNNTDFGLETGFDQNRIFAGVGLKRGPQSRWRMEIGYLNQSLHVPIIQDRSNHILSINLYRSR